MAFRICVILLLAYFSASFIHGADAGLLDCPDVYYNGFLVLNGFDCPRSWIDTSEQTYCCDSGESYERCCTFKDYFGYDEYFGLSVGAIIGIGVGSLVFIVAVIVSIIVCCVCCVKAAATPTHHPVTMHTISVPQQPGSVTVPQPAAPGYYYPPSTQSVPPPNYVNQQAQQPPLPGDNPAYQKY
ncbi:protein shisa-5-like [Patiria miniata]|uniref:Uncharacterized protein n=1 Tax=Patiria miniata TaxID=46514 RepID=A0A914B4V8_PATMI|nr:protein shisa-5-like [Patiria miniata]